MYYLFLVSWGVILASAREQLTLNVPLLVRGAIVKVNTARRSTFIYLHNVTCYTTPPPQDLGGLKSLKSFIFSWDIIFPFVHCVPWWANNEVGREGLRETVSFVVFIRGKVPSFMTIVVKCVTSFLMWIVWGRVNWHCDFIFKYSFAQF